jgi:hypothetical protein
VFCELSFDASAFAGESTSPITAFNCSLGKPNLGLQHLAENAKRVSSDNLG